ncbi:hypothetical protein IP88_13575 [alpha proteobacterium AAP81b]|nr:hypothetical protein IP88_13575 [alpha proteobacterium AAP81b]
MLARRFLWLVAIAIMLVIAAGFAWALAGNRLITAALVPSAPYVAPAPRDTPDYAAAKNWLARPDLPSAEARWTPAGATAATAPQVAVFYVVPTSVFDRTRWNAAIGDPAVAVRARMFLRGQATVFNGVGAIWAPAYRQATFGAFLTDKPEARAAIAEAYGDVLAAFDAFVAAQPADRPLILAGHSQGSLHLLRLLKDRVAGRPLAKRIVAVYAIGWPISLTADLPALGLPACATPQATRCLLSWQSFARPADYTLVREAFDGDTGLTGAPRRGTAILCTNPLAGAPTAAALPAAANHGSLVPNDDFSGGALITGGIGAHCRDGILDIGEPTGAYKAYILPGNNFHVYDYALFWADVRADAARRVAAFAAQ